MPNPGHLIVTCPACGSPSGEPCKTLKTRRTTDTHTDRVVASVRIRADHPTAQRHLRLVE